MKQPKVFVPEPPSSIPPVVEGPRYRYFSTPPKTVTIALADLVAQIPVEARTAKFSEAGQVELPCAEILQGPSPKIRLSKLAEILPDVLKAGTSDLLVRLPAARLAANYRFVNTQELIEDKPLPPLEPMPDFSSHAEPAEELDVPPDEFSPADLAYAPKDFAPTAPVPPKPAPPASVLPPTPPAAPEFAPPPPVTPPPPVPVSTPAADMPKPAKKPFSLLPIFRRKETVTPAPEPPSAQQPATVEPRPRVEIPKQRSVLPPITARVAEASAAIPMQPTPQQAPEPSAFTPTSEPETPKSAAEVAPEPVLSQEPDPAPLPLEEEAPVSEPAVQSAPAETPSAVWVETEHLPKSPVGRSVEIPDQDGLQSVFMTEEVLSVERVLELSGGLPGIKSCILSQGSTVVASHNVPDTIDLVSLSANAVEMLKAMRQSVAKMGVGAIPAVTIHSEKGPITFFHQEDLCLLVLHKDRGFVPGVREKLQQVVTELSRTNLALPVSPIKPSLGE